MKKYDYLIVGAGLFGAVFARQATDAGKRCLVIDKREHIGGNVYTQNVDGINVHLYGAHIFHTSDENTWRYVNRFAQFNNYVNSPIADYHGERYNLPFNMNTFKQLWGVETADEARQIIESQRKEYAVIENLEQQAISLVGTDVYEKLVKGYTEKQWGRPCNQLPAFIIRRLPVRFEFNNNYFNDTYQGIPIGGYTQMVANMLHGVEVQLNTDFFDSREELVTLADKVIYTGAIDRYFDYCYGALDYRSLRFETSRLEQPDYQGTAVVNYTDRETPYTRIIEHKYFESAQTPHTVITKEYPSTWSVGDEPYYPVNDEKNQALYQRYQQLAAESNVIFGGRLGEYKYYDMDKVVAAALALAEKEL